MITQDQLDDSTWGTGYGSKKHLVDHERSKLREPGVRFSYDEIHVRCSSTIVVDQLDTTKSEPWSQIENRQPCARCQKIADAEVSA